MPKLEFRPESDNEMLGVAGETLHPGDTIETSDEHAEELLANPNWNLHVVPSNTPERASRPTGSQGPSGAAANDQSTDGS
jgi:hypothetical protein